MFVCVCVCVCVCVWVCTALYGAYNYMGLCASLKIHLSVSVRRVYAISHILSSRAALAMRILDYCILGRRKTAS